jgi:hypothetical protein
MWKTPGRTALADDDVLASLRIAEYNVTMAPGHGRRTGLAAPVGSMSPVVTRPRDTRPMVALVREPVEPVEPARLVVVPDAPVEDVEHTPAASGLEVGDVSSLDPAFLERRLEQRGEGIVAIAAAACDGAGSTALGETVNLSTSGLLARMDLCAPSDDVDLLVGESYSMVLRGRVVAERKIDDGYLWHIAIVDADPEWYAAVDLAHECSDDTD